MSLSFIIPSYNEEKNIVKTVAEVVKSVELSTLKDYEILIINDASTDNTGEKVNKILNDYNNIKYINNKKNLGYGGSFKAALLQASKKNIILVDGNNSYDAEEIAKLIREIGSADIISSCYSNPEFRPWYRTLLTNTNSLILNFLFRLKLPYYNGNSIYKKSDLESIDFSTNSHAFLPIILIKLLKIKKLSIVFIPLKTKINAGITSTFRPKNIFKILSSISNTFLILNFKFVGIPLILIFLLILLMIVSGIDTGAIYNY